MQYEISGSVLAGQITTTTWAEAAVARATVPPQAFNSAADLPRARLGRRQRSIGPGRAVDQGGSARDVGLGGGSVEDLGLVQGDRWGWPRHRWGWPARVVDLAGTRTGGLEALQLGGAHNLDLGEGCDDPIVLD